jgi:integrase
LLDAIAGDRLAAMFRVFLAIGNRKGELCALKMSDVDLDTGQVTLQRRLVRLLGSGIDVDVPKSSASIRRVVLSGAALAGLRAWRDQQ